MMVPSLTSAGSGSGTPGTPGKSAELRREGEFVQWRQTGGVWADLIPLADISGDDGDPGLNGLSVEMRKTATAIQWRPTDGMWVDLVLLADLKGEPGNDFAVQYSNGVVDVGPVRQAWGVADSVPGASDYFAFPSDFAAPPVVQITRGSVGPALNPHSVTKLGFSISRGDLLPNPIPFSWLATGLKPDPTVVQPTRFEVSNLPTWSAAVRAQRAGLRNARILCIGDSTTAGHGAYAVGMGSNARAGSYPTSLCSILTARGSISRASSVIGNGAVATEADLVAYDNRIATTGNWDYATGIQGSTQGGFLIRGLVDTSRLHFSPLNQCDTFEFFYLQRNLTAGGGFMLGINNSDKLSISATWKDSDPAHLEMAKVTVALAQNTLNVRALDSNGAFFAGIIAYNSAVKEISVLNAGWGGAIASDFNNSRMSYSPLPAITAYNPDLVVINCGINDFNRSPATEKSIWSDHIQSVITAAKASGADVLLAIPNEISGTYASGHAVFKIYIQELAAKNGVKIVDIPAKIGTYTVANASGHMRDAIHPNAAGYTQIATAVADIIMPVGV